MLSLAYSRTCILLTCTTGTRLALTTKRAKCTRFSHSCSILSHLVCEGKKGIICPCFCVLSLLLWFFFAGKKEKLLKRQKGQDEIEEGVWCGCGCGCPGSHCHYHRLRAAARQPCGASNQTSGHVKAGSNADACRAERGEFCIAPQSTLLRETYLSRWMHTLH